MSDSFSEENRFNTEEFAREFTKRKMAMVKLIKRTTPPIETN